MGKDKLMMIIIIALLVIILGTVAGVSVYLINLMNKQANGEATGDETIAAVIALKPDEMTPVVLGDEILTNLAKGPENKQRILKAQVVLRYDNTQGKASTDFATLLEINVDVARSIALACMRSQTGEVLETPEGQDDLAVLIKTRLQEEFHTTLIVDVMFRNWLLQ